MAPTLTSLREARPGPRFALHSSDGMARSSIASAAGVAALALAAARLGAGCGGDDAPPGGAPDASTAGDTGSPPVADAGVTFQDDGGNSDASTSCKTIDDTQDFVVATASAAEEHALTLELTSEGQTQWSRKGLEALVLEVKRGPALVGHVLVHQGKTRFVYGMHVGKLAPGDPLSVRVSPLSAGGVARRACLGRVELTPASALGAAGEGLVNAPVYVWPTQKRFDDVPVVVGWSKAKKSYETVFTSENGGTVQQCGGGAKGIRSEIERWGRACDIEGSYSYGSPGRWGRCTGTTDVSATAPRFEAAHPVLYYGDGHNRLFESRGGYGQACGTGGAEKSDGDIVGWNTGNPGNEPEKDGAFAVVLRPLPVDLDALGFAQYGGRREALVDRYAPWVYRLTFLELEREGKIDDAMTRPLAQYLYVDVLATDVNGTGDRNCDFFGANNGFVLRAKAGGVTYDGPQMTADFFGGQPGWKRIAIPLGRGYRADEITDLVFDAYDNDGIYFMAVGDAFIPKAQGDNGASLDYVRKGDKKVEVYVDDNQSGCTGGKNYDGPGDAGYPCTGSDYSFKP